MRLLLLGSGSIVPTPERFASSIFVESGEKKLLLDIGPGTIEKAIRFGADLFSVGYVLITHYHIDHVSDLLPFLKSRAYDRQGGIAKNPLPINVIGPRGLRELVSSLIESNRFFRYLESTMRYSTYTNLIEVTDGVRIEQDGLRIEARSVRHYDGVAYKLFIDGKTVVYSGDTVVDENLIELAKGVDVLIHECSFPSSSLLGLHTDEVGLGNVLERTRPKIVVVTHLYPQWKGREEEIVEALLSRHRCRVVIARDGLELRI